MTKPRRARRAGLLSLAGSLSVDLDARYPEAPRRSLDEWLALPPERRAPRAAIAMYSLARGKVRIAIIDTQAHALHSMIEGPRRVLPRFLAAFSSHRAAPPAPHAAPRAASPSPLPRTRFSGLELADIKNDGTGPTGGPRVVDPDPAPLEMPDTAVA